MRKQFFSTIESGLKKYERITLENQLVKAYLDNPLEALAKDEKLGIVKVLEKMKETIEKKEFELKGKKRDKILKELEHTGRKNFEEFLEERKELRKDIEELKLKIEDLGITKKLEEKRKELEDQQAELKEKEDKIEDMKKRREEIDLDQLKTQLETNIQEKLKENIKIIL